MSGVPASLDDSGLPEASVALPPAGPGGRGPSPRLVRARFRLDDGHKIGVAIAGTGLPLVVVHGFAAEGIVYAQTLSRLVAMGFKVIAIDSPAHGGTDPLRVFSSLDAYVDLLRCGLDRLGLPQAVLVGHSMGGRLVAELAAREPERALAVVLVNAIAGDAWDRLNRLLLVAPAGYLGVGAVLLADVAASLPLREDPLQSLKLARLIFPTSANHVRRPWRLLGPFQAIARARASSGALERLRAAAIPTVVIHGERDLAVPLSTGRASAARAGADLVVVAGAGHSWLLGDPEAFPAIIAEQLEVGLLGRARTAALAARGLASDATAAEIEAAFINPASLVSALTPPAGGGRERGRPPRLRWTTTPAHSVMDPESGYSATTA